MPESSELVRWLIPAIMMTAALGVPAALWWEKRHPRTYPGSAAHEAALQSVQDGTAPNLAEWRRMPTSAQAYWDEQQLKHGAAVDAYDAALAARAAEERARVNVLFRP
ncbi:hypothetical protein [Streptomyces sp. NPDC047868]|uniref:hypothetical protein n=1 Tax=Streptomyces sp. NPDC047868 TaxID=3155480 RepID=UPI003451BB86